MSAINDGTGWKGRLDYDGRRVALENISCVWYRRPTRFQFHPELSPSQVAFALGEAPMGMGGLLRSLNCLWVNHPEAQVTADYKPFQLHIAAGCGLRVPRTFISNDPEEAHHFFEACDGQMIYKTMSRGQVFNDSGALTGVIYTSSVTKQDLSDSDRIRHTCCLFQERISKQLELRITVIGTTVFAAEIHSQQYERAALDWRRGYEGLAYGVHSLPSEIREKCLLLTGRLGLHFAAIDMIVTPQGDYVFLELNPSGQWAWIEMHTALPLRGAICDLLMSPPPHPDRMVSDLAGIHQLTTTAVKRH